MPGPGPPPASRSTRPCAVTPKSPGENAVLFNTENRAELGSLTMSADWDLCSSRASLACYVILHHSISTTFTPTCLRGIWSRSLTAGTSAQFSNLAAVHFLLFIGLASISRIPIGRCALFIIKPTAKRRRRSSAGHTSHLHPWHPRRAVHPWHSAWHSAWHPTWHPTHSTQHRKSASDFAHCLIEQLKL